MQTNVNLDDLGTGKSDNFVFQQKFSPIDKFRNESIIESLYCVKTVQIRSFFWPVFSPNAGKYRPEKTPYLDTFHAVSEHYWLLKEAS